MTRRALSPPGSSNVEALREAHLAWNARLYSRAALLAAPLTMVTDHYRGQLLTTRSMFDRWLREWVAVASNVQLVEARYVEGGDWVTAMYRLTGTQDGALGHFPPSGERFSLDVCETWRFNADGYAVEGHFYTDGLGLLLQLGHLEHTAGFEAASASSVSIH